MPVLGYDVDPRGGRLVVKDGEAARVGEIFRLYARSRSLATTVAELQRREWTTKSCSVASSNTEPAWREPCFVVRVWHQFERNATRRLEKLGDKVFDRVHRTSLTRT